jgi:hypothetical protein
MRKALILLLALPCLFVCCKKDPVRVIDSTYNPDVKLANFSNPTNFTNPYWPHELGKSYILESKTPEGLEKIEKVRIADTKVVMGITCAVIHDRVWLNNVLIEETFDWHAQDNAGNLWYFGEKVVNFNPNGTFKDNAGSWEAGVDGAKPGIVMPAAPMVGMRYREEYFFNEAEDEAEIVSMNEAVSTPFGAFTNCVKTRNWTELDPDADEFKWYAPKVGVVKVVKVGDNQTEELVRTEGGYQVDVKPSKFLASTQMTNAYMPFPLGKKYIYRQITPDGTERIEVERLGNKVVMGIACVVIHDVVFLNNIRIEETWDWYAQDNSGNLWYFGEDVDNYDHATGAFKNHEGAWEAGVGGALPGIMMPASPKTGDEYREEYFWGEAEDEAEVVQTGLMNVVTPYGTFNNCIKTRNFTRLSPGEAFKIYAPGIGPIKEVNEDGEELILIEIK